MPTALRLDRRAFLRGVGGVTLALPVLDAMGAGVTEKPPRRFCAIYTANGMDGNLVIIDQVNADTYKLAEAATTRPWAKTMAVDFRTKKVYLVTAEGTVDPSKPRRSDLAPFYPNRFFPGTFTVLIYSPK